MGRIYAASTSESPIDAGGPPLPHGAGNPTHKGFFNNPFKGKVVGISCYKNDTQTQNHAVRPNVAHTFMSYSFKAPRREKRG